MPPPATQLDAFIVGGGIAGLLTLDALHRRGCRVWLLERNALGSGQTIWSQGIIHGGLKYALGGEAGEAARAVSNMPARWSAMLNGQSDPNLSAVHMRANACAVWATSGMRSIAGLLGAQFTLRTKPTPWPVDSLPEALAGVRTKILQIAEPVLEPMSLLSVLGSMHHNRVLLGDISSITPTDECINVELTGGLRIRAGKLILTAGAGNASLRSMADLPADREQTRPLQMILARGPLPVLNGHCIRSTQPWLTITTVAGDSETRVWQIGGQVAERGAEMTSAATIQAAVQNVRAAMPNLSLEGTEWSTYLAPRSEYATGQGGRPDRHGLIEDDRIITAWPTKLALAPLLADDIAHRISANSGSLEVPADMARPTTATPPWQEDRVWTPVHSAAPA
ncbi:MAG: FAD-dependent oxidoreductase [Phycisphaerales bacterium]|nr:FAD-dependent oxidoreductase [Phycisphaerales bacterium]